MTNRLLRKQNGYTLIWVLLIVVLIGVLTPPLVSKVLSSKLQVQRTEKAIQLEKVRLMGVTYMESVINHANDELVKKSDSLLDSKQYKESLQQKINEIDSQFTNEVVKVLKVNGQQFRLKINTIKIIDDNKVVITYAVTSSLNDSTQPKVSNEEVVIHIVKE
ncbi:type II secretion system protein [Saccharococcus sp. Marseille-Q5394]|uniref:type II secretion system protein n=1 Tax=Saccharococcus sp. Marseille-Q5394 TaxID=2972778 RepID=UPI0021C9C5E2|nr:type II secretion system protein [Saccharococcus sp. Marseille-Q5394]